MFHLTGDKLDTSSCQELDYVRTVPGFSHYTADRDGNIYSLRKGGRMLSQYVNGEGYLCTQMTDDDGRSRSMRAHVVIALAFMGERPEGYHVAHSPDPTKTNNKASNLSYKSPKDNVADALRDGTRGLAVTKLDPVKVREIRALAAEGLPQTQIAKRYGVTRYAILRVLSGERWGWVE